MTAGAIQAVPMTYRSTRFRSTLEADWAATFDSLDWRNWSYEPEALCIDGTNYLCDFYLSHQRVWCEVKGPHNERIDKPRILQRALDMELERARSGDPQAEWWLAAGPAPLVVILRPPRPGDTACWEAATDNLGEHDVRIAECPQCHHFYFLDLCQDWSCRYGCDRRDVEPGLPYSQYFNSGELAFTRAPRPARSAAA